MMLRFHCHHAIHRGLTRFHGLLGGKTASHFASLENAWPAVVGR
jgi:hypothetical protein